MKWSELTDRERDALVAEKVMDWDGLWTDGTHYMMYPPCEQNLGVGYEERHPIPNFTTSIVDAWIIVEKLKESHDVVAIVWCDGSWVCTITDFIIPVEEKDESDLLESDLIQEWQYDSPNDCEAICIAALKAVGVEIEE